MKRVYQCLILSLAVFAFANAQEAPRSGKKVLDVKESYEGEYMQNVTKGDLSTAVVNALEKRVPKKLQKYGFEKIEITKIGKVKTPTSTTRKMSDAVGGNRGAGKAQLEVAKTSKQIETAVDKIYAENVDNDWKLQVNFIDLKTQKEFRVRLSIMSYNPKYIIKESDLVKDLRK
ncbi:hypothetical protein [uncultured Dokdonia sp.]|uniref:hypothetical protein n=1 Tax=uncultured Dokdonia sp. TaxID=575653 RepID=UPI00261C1EDE|nr:hypothetical protein [uncultured Dokdonia sp.]